MMCGANLSLKMRRVMMSMAPMKPMMMARYGMMMGGLSSSSCGVAGRVPCAVTLTL